MTKLSTLQALAKGHHYYAGQCLDLAAELIQERAAYEKQKAALTAQTVNTFMCSGDVEVLLRFLPPAPPSGVDTVNAEMLSCKVCAFLMAKNKLHRLSRNPRFVSYEVVAAARCFLHSLIREAQGKPVGDLDALNSFLEANGISTPSAQAEGGLATQCIRKMIPPCDQPHPLTKELLEKGGSILRMKATSVLQGMDRCLYKEHPGRAALQLAAWAVSATLRVKEADEVLVEKAARYAHSKGIDVAGPLVEYILRRKY
jgi:hypothetical protein